MGGVLFTLAAKVRPGDRVYLGSDAHPSHVLAVSPAPTNKLRITTDAGSELVDRGQRIRVG